MDGLNLLAEARKAGLVVRAEGPRLVVRGPRDQEALAKRLLSQKAEVLALLRGPIPPWDQAEADRLLTELRDGLARIERERYRGRFPPLLAKVVGGGLAVCETYVRDHEREAARGWDALELLRGAVPGVLSMARGDRWQGQKPPWET
jgi:hypothetical protein